MPTYVSAAGDQDYGAFVTVTESALEQETVFKSTTQHVCPPRLQSSMPGPSGDSANRPVVAPSAPERSAKPATSVYSPAAGSSKTCSNCGLTGHLAPTCFKPGGGMAGQQDEFRRNRNQVVAMMIASLDEAYDMADVEVPDMAFPTSPPQEPEDTPVVSTVSPTLSSQNENVHHDVYAMRDSCVPRAFSTTSDTIDQVALFSLWDRFNACLDSGCTDHIVQDRHLFETYDTAGAVEIGTANCSALSAKASGDVSFYLPYRN